MRIFLAPILETKKVFLLTFAALVGCAGQSDDGRTSRAALISQQAAFASEPHEVRIIDRSRFDRRFWPTDIKAPQPLPSGTIFIDTKNKFLYLHRSDGTARRYGIAVGGTGHSWSGTAKVGRKAEWPAWFPTDDMRNLTPGLPHKISPGSHNPLGARALYLYQNGKDTLYRVHGTSEPWTIGTEASSGCIRMINEDVIDLYDKVPIGATVIVK
ncbi:L,D-transpeptidase catalytic domain protein (plasmid) [Ochrobactrum quorumnocens]|uniref:L,D-transpeptidase catalytic domain protein n=1 Tax=Ochrobactrum quorumnocens TaxID=271865 RepID=A0A248UMI3_9HYPH|nr:L,D-transpeptidase [[Ochrobactrum] quorumnocens]ASV88063.1 L,D-transpeptidase catalytic domain protein [[Ochrobactrum] quorumnocens]